MRLTVEESNTLFANMFLQKLAELGPGVDKEADWKHWLGTLLGLGGSAAIPYFLTDLGQQELLEQKAAHEAQYGSIQDAAQNLAKEELLKKYISPIVSKETVSEHLPNIVSKNLPNIKETILKNIMEQVTPPSTPVTSIGPQGTLLAAGKEKPKTETGVPLVLPKGLKVPEKKKEQTPEEILNEQDTPTDNPVNTLKKTLGLD